MSGLGRQVCTWVLLLAGLHQSQVSQRHEEGGWGWLGGGAPAWKVWLGDNAGSKS